MDKYYKSATNPKYRFEFANLLRSNSKIRRVWRVLHAIKKSFVPPSIFQWVNRADVDAVFDVGANIGQFASDARSAGYRGRIYSFEPVASTFSFLSRRFAKDANWSGFELALSDETGVSFIGVSANSGLSSSFLVPTDLHIQEFPDAEVIRREKVKIVTLDDLIANQDIQFSRGFLKMDVQGFEDKVLRGSRNSLKRFKFVQLECSLKPLYQDEPTIYLLSKILNQMKFRIIDFEEGIRSASGELMQIDILFINTEID